MNSNSMKVPETSQPINFNNYRNNFKTQHFATNQHFNVNKPMENSFLLQHYFKPLPNCRQNTPTSISTFRPQQIVTVFKPNAINHNST